MSTESRDGTPEEIKRLRDDLVAMIRSGASAKRIDQWAEAYTFGRRACIEVIRLLLEEPENRPARPMPHTVDIVDGLMCVLDQDGNGCGCHELRGLRNAKRQLHRWQEQYTFDYAKALRAVSEFFANH